MYPGTCAQSTPEKTAILPEDTGESAELEQELIDHVKATIARDKAPRSVDVAEEPPRSATGTPVEGELRTTCLEAASS